MHYTDYKREVLSDATDALSDYVDYYDDFADAYDQLWINDSVTGNGSGSYTFSTYQAELNTRDLVWDDDFASALADMGMTIADALKDGPESCDVIARCCALSEVAGEIEDAWDELKGADNE